MRSLRPLLLSLVLAGCSRTPPPMTTMAPKSDFAQWIHSLFLQVIGWDSLILCIVGVAMALALFRFSTRSSGQKGETPPKPVHGSLGLELAWTIGPALVLLAIAIPTIKTTFRAQPAEPPANAMEVDITAHQWWWEVEYPDYDVKTANEIHLPTGQPVTFVLKSADVIHSFWVPALGGKRDVVPGHTNMINLIARVPGMYLGQCAEFCGTSHANMRFRVFVETPAQFKKWIAHQAAPPVVPGRPTGGTNLVAEGARLFASSPCVTCHTIRGVATQRVGPDLTHFASRTTFAGATLANTPQNLAAWLKNPDALKPGAEMPNLGLSSQEVSELVAYLESLK